MIHVSEKEGLYYLTDVWEIEFELRCMKFTEHSFSNKSSSIIEVNIKDKTFRSMQDFECLYHTYPMCTLQTIKNILRKNKIDKLLNESIKEDKN